MIAACILEPLKWEQMLLVYAAERLSQITSKHIQGLCRTYGHKTPEVKYLYIHVAAMFWINTYKPSNPKATS